MRLLAILALIAVASAVQLPHPEVLPGGQTGPPLDKVCTAEDVAHKFKGTVLLQLVVDTKGRPHNIVVARKLRKDLDKAAVEAVETWTFNPAKRGGQPVAVMINVEVSFDCDLSISSPLAPESATPPVLPPADASLLCTDDANRDKAVGKTTLQIDIDEKGSVHNPRVVTPFRKDLDEQALKAAKEWQFASSKKGALAAKTFSIDVTFDCRERIYTVGSGVTPPKAVFAPDPVLSNYHSSTYTAPTVMLVVVNTEGRVVNARLQRSSGDRSLDRSALEAVRKWRFDPAMKDGHPVAARINVEVKFNLP